MAYWNLLAEALSVLEGHCGNKVIGTAYLCCLPVSGPHCICYIMYTKLVINLTSALLSTTCHLEINFSFSAERYIFASPCLVYTCAFCPEPIWYTRQMLMTFKW